MSKEWCFAVTVRFERDVTRRDARRFLQDIADRSTEFERHSIEKITVENCTIGKV